MSFRRRSWGRRGGGRRMWLPADDDLPLSLLAMITKSIQNQMKKTPQKKASRGRGRRRAPAPATPAISPPPPAPVIAIEDTPETAKMLNDVESKMGTFMESGSFISSDEEEDEMMRTKSKKKPSASVVFLSDDSDDDFKMVPQASGASNFGISMPSTSAGTSSSCFKDNKLVNPSTGSNSEDPQNVNMNTTDDIMEFVESLNSCADSNNENKSDNLRDMKSLEEFRKETEEMLKDASTLLDEIKTGRKPQPEPPKEEEESSSNVTIGSCPICLESLAGRPASVTVCGHIFCKNCITQTAKTLKTCPTCRKAITLKKIHPIYF